MLPNLSYIPNYISATEEQNLMQLIDEQVWMLTFKRRVQHHGYIYDYKKRTVTPNMYLGELPDWLSILAKHLKADGHISETPDQVIINEYHAGQGIALHVDCEPCFGDTILSLSLGSPCVMNFRHLESQVMTKQLLEPRSLLVMSKEARYDWQHGIAARKTEKIDGRNIKRGRRISLTFRKVIL